MPYQRYRIVNKRFGDRYHGGVAYKAKLNTAEMKYVAQQLMLKPKQKVRFWEK